MAKMQHADASHTAAEPLCRLCRATLPKPFLNLGDQPPSNAYLRDDQKVMADERRYTLAVRLCVSCGLVQADDSIPADMIFDAHYAYFSSFSDSWLLHCRQYTSTVIERFLLGPDSMVVEVASNDGYLLQYFRDAGIAVLGIEPTANTAAVARARGIVTENCFFNKATGRALAARGLQADLIHGANVLAHVPEIDDFIAGFPLVLKPDGVITLEFPHLLKLVEHVQFDTIYHEHFSYLSLAVAQLALRRHGLEIFDVEELPTHGGSIRLYAAHAASARTATPAVDALLIAERSAGLDRPETYTQMAEQVEAVRRCFADFLAGARRDGKRIAAYGAAAKGNTFLNSCGTTANDIVCVFDKSPHKQGKRLPGSHLPILSPDRIAEIRPDYLLILPWNIKSEIVEQLTRINSWGALVFVADPFIRVLNP